MLARGLSNIIDKGGVSKKVGNVGTTGGRGDRTLRKHGRGWKQQVI